jgi:hypothetical protein
MKKVYDNIIPWVIDYKSQINVSFDVIENSNKINKYSFSNVMKKFYMTSLILKNIFQLFRHYLYNVIL